MIFPTKVLIRTPKYQWNNIRVLSVKAQPKIDQSNEKITKESLEANWESARPYNSIPGETMFSLIRGNLPGGKYYKKSFKDFCKIMREEFGDIYKIPGFMGKPDVVMTYCPKDMEMVYRTEGIWPTRRGGDTMQHYRNDVKPEFYKGAEGLVTSAGTEWGKFRSAVNPVLMNPSSMRLYLPKIEQVNREFIQRIKDIRDEKTLEVPKNFIEEINRLTFESVAVVALDQHLGLILSNRENPEAMKLFKTLTRCFDLMLDLDIKPSLWRVIRTPKYHEMMAVMDTINEITGKLVNKAIERINNDPDRQNNGSEESILEKLLKIDKKIAIVMVTDMLFAGVDTTSTIVAGVLASIATNPEKQEKLREEMRKVLPQKSSHFTMENIKNLPYLRACIKESMRVYPLGIGNLRATGQDVVLSGYQVPKNIDVGLHQEDITKDKNNFERPEEFIPERWLRNNDPKDGCPSSRDVNPFVFLPFGFGPRMCVGKRIVDMELEMTLGKLVRNFNLEFNYPTDDLFACTLINYPNKPLTFKFTDIEN